MTDLWSFHTDVGADSADLDGMTVEATDGSVGKVQDVVDDVDGAYLLVDTGLPLIGKTIFLPAGLFPDLGIPTWTPAANVFLRLLGAAYLAIALVEILGFAEAAHRRSAAMLGLISSAVTSLVLCRDIFYGELWNWGVFGWALMMMWLLLYAVFAVALLVTGLPVLLGRAETTHAAARRRTLP